MDLLNFGNTLKELRTQNGMTQQQLATQIGVSKSVVSYYELQERTPSPEILLKLASIFHVSSDYLLGIEKNNVLDVSGLEAALELIDILQKEGYVFVTADELLIE